VATENQNTRNGRKPWSIGATTRVAFRRLRAVTGLRLRFTVAFTAHCALSAGAFVGSSCCEIAGLVVSIRSLIVVSSSKVRRHPNSCDYEQYYRAYHSQYK
jgi:hypothetical protein